MLSPAQKTFLGLAAKESDLLRVLQKGSLNTSGAAKAAKLPRVTALRLLSGLWKRGFIGRHKQKREVSWSPIGRALMRKRLELALDEESPGRFNKTVPLTDLSNVLLYKGLSELLASNQKMLASHPGERVYFIEPNAIWKHAARIPPSEWVRLNKMLKQRNIIAEVVVEEGYENILSQYGGDWSESFFALADDVRVMPKNSMPSPVEIIVVKDRVILADWEQLAGIEIVSSSVVKAFRGLFAALQSVSRPMS